MGKAEDAVILSDAMRRIDQMGKTRVAVSDLLGEGVKLQDVPNHVFLTALAERVSKYQRDGIAERAEFDGTRKAIENKINSDAPLTDTEKQILMRLLAAITELDSE